jgi:hypothetical protein
MTRFHSINRNEEILDGFNINYVSVNGLEISLVENRTERQLPDGKGNSALSFCFMYL